MSLIQAVALGLIQGATEFLPISSSAHLVLIPWLLGWRTPSLAFGVLVHWATTAAVVGYFWRDWVALAQGCYQALRSRSLADPQARRAVLLALGTVPAAVAGMLLKDFFESLFARPVATAGFLLVTAATLTLGEGLRRADRALDSLGWRDVLVIGLAQATAITPGISRSGATIVSGMARGLDRESAARFSFLLATPIVLGAGLVEVAQLAHAPDLLVQAPFLAAGFASALASGVLCIHWLLRHLRQRPLYLFALYCAVFAILCLVVAVGTGHVR